MIQKPPVFCAMWKRCCILFPLLLSTSWCSLLWALHSSFSTNHHSLLPLSQLRSSRLRHRSQRLSSLCQLGLGRRDDAHPRWCQLPYDLGFTFRHDSMKSSSASYSFCISSSSLERQQDNRLKKKPCFWKSNTKCAGSYRALTSQSPSAAGSLSCSSTVWRSLGSKTGAAVWAGELLHPAHYHSSEWQIEKKKRSGPGWKWLLLQFWSSMGWQTILNIIKVIL